MENTTPLLIATLALLFHGTARAGTVDVANTTTVVGSDGQAYSSIGADFQTMRLAATGSAHGATYTLNLAYATTFNGMYGDGNVNTYYPDIFLSVPGGTPNASGYEWAVSLGDEAANGGQAAGFYTPKDVADSRSVWAGRSGYIYGAGYQQGGSGAVSDAPVVMLAGTQVGRTGVSSTVIDTHTQQNGLELYTLSVTITGLSSALAGMFDHGFDAFWGTGDCANGAFLVSTTVDPFVAAVAEPGSGVLALMGVSMLVVCRGKARWSFQRGR